MLPAATDSPQRRGIYRTKNHPLRTVFCKNPCKNATPPQNKKNLHQNKKRSGPATAEPPAFLKPTYTEA
jgi:phage portal protein BeeE